MHRIFYFFIFLMISQLSLSQDPFIEGIVRDASDGRSIPGANVFDEDNNGTTTDINGYYKLSLSSGDHIISYSFVGYKTTTRSVFIVNEGNEKIDVKLLLETEFLDVIVVSAGKFEQSLSDITVSMEVIKPKLIQDRNTTTLQSILQVTPGVTIVNNEPQIRSGSGFSFGTGSRVQVLIDDLPILSGDAGRPTWSYLPIENLEQMEIIKGASSVLYGSSALSGVINIRTAYPREIPKTEVTLFTGRYSDPSVEEAVWWNESNSINGGLTFLHSRKIQSLDLVLSGNYFSDQGYIGPDIVNPADTSFFPERVNRNGFENRGRISLSVRKNFKNNPNIKIGLNTNFYTNKSTSTLLWLNGDTGLYRPSPGSLTFTDQNAFHLDPFIEYYTKKGGKHSLRSRFYSLDNLNTNNQSNFSDVWYTEYQYTQHFDSLNIPDFVSTFGAVYEDVSAESDLFAGNEGGAGMNTANKFAFYLQLDKKFFEKLSLSVGFRNENFEINGSKENATIFRSGLNYKFAEASFLRASYGQGFRFPSIGEKFIKTQISSLFIYPNNDLRSEKSWNLELGIKQGFKVRNLKGFADLALFQQEYDRFVEFTFGQWGQTSDPGLGLGFKSLNTGQARVSGLELTIAGSQKIKTTELNILLGYAFTKPISLTPEYIYEEVPGSFWPNPNYLNTSSDTTENILKYRMQHAIRGDISLDLKKFHFGISGRYNSNMSNIDRIFEDLDTDGILETGLAKWRAANNKGDAVFDFRTGYKISKNAKLSLIINNVLNRAYAMRPLAIEAPRLVTIQFKTRI